MKQFLLFFILSISLVYASEPKKIEALPGTMAMGIEDTKKFTKQLEKAITPKNLMGKNFHKVYTKIKPFR